MFNGLAHQVNAKAQRTQMPGKSCLGQREKMFDVVQLRGSKQTEVEADRNVGEAGLIPRSHVLF